MRLLCTLKSHTPAPVAARSAVSRLLRFWVRFPPGAWMFLCCRYCVLSGRGLCDGLITPPEESYRLCCVVVCDQKTSWMRRPWPTGGCCTPFPPPKKRLHMTLWSFERWINYRHNEDFRFNVWRRRLYCYVVFCSAAKLLMMAKWDSI